VLWVLVLITITVGTFAILTRTENLQAHQVLSGTRARYAAEAGLNLAVLKLRSPDLESRWVPDGRPYEIQFEDALLEIRVIDERGKVDINTADELMLGNLLISQDMEENRIIELVDAILDWRDTDDLVRLNGAEEREYEAAGISYGPANMSFRIVEELQQVLGLDHDLYRTIEPALTVYSRGSRIDPAFAPYEALVAIPGMTPELAEEFIAQREDIDPADPQGLLLPDGTPVTGRGVGNTHTIKVKATMPNQIWEQIEVTVSLAGRGGAPFQILRWREGVGG